VHQPLEGLVGRGRRRRRDGDHDDYAGDVLGATEAVRVAAGRRTPPEHERHSEGHCGERIGGVVQGIAEQRHRSRHRHLSRLELGGDEQRTERDPEHAHAFLRGLHRRIDPVGRIVGVWGDHVPDALERAAMLVVRMAVIVVIRVVMQVLAIVVVVVLGAHTLALPSRSAPCVAACSP
jgi:hypothetical protein